MSGSEVAQERGRRRVRGGGHPHLIHEDDRRHRRQFDADVDALLLPAGDAALGRVAHEVVADVLDAQHAHHVDDVLDLLALGEVARQAQHGVVEEVLVHGEVGVHDVVLRHEAWSRRGEARGEGGA